MCTSSALYLKIFFREMFIYSHADEYKSSIPHTEMEGQRVKKKKEAETHRQEGDSDSHTQRRREKN